VAQWDVFVNPSPRTREAIPCVLVLQGDLLDALSTRLVAPLAREAPAPVGVTGRLTPRLIVAGMELVLVVHEAAPIDARSLRQLVGNVRDSAHLVIDALDAVVSGV
jgi:toxin CcdB